MLNCWSELFGTRALTMIPLGEIERYRRPEEISSTLHYLPPTQSSKISFPVAEWQLHPTQQIYRAFISA